MSYNTFGRIFRVTTFGESHGPAIGCVIDGCPPGLEISADEIRKELLRRATGRSRHTSQRREKDEVEILSGTFEGHSTGTPIALVVYNTDARPGDYAGIATKFRPGHADYTYWKKYGTRDYRGGGRSSARETTMRVAAGAVAKKFLRQEMGIDIYGWLAQLGPIRTDEHFSREAIGENPFFCPDPDLVPLRVDYEWLARVKKTHPELPDARRARLVQQYGLPEYDAQVLTSERALADYFEEVVRLGSDGKTASNWVMGEVLRVLRELDLEIAAFPVSPSGLAELLKAVGEGAVSQTAAKDVFAEMVRTGKSAPVLVEDMGLAQVSDPKTLGPLVERVLAREQAHVAEFHAGRTKVFGYLVGQVMRATRGKANPQVVNRLLAKQLDNLS